MTASRPLLLALGLLIALPCLAANDGDGPGKSSPAAPTGQALTPAQPAAPDSLKPPVDPSLGALAMTCTGSFTTPTQVATASTCSAAQSALIAPLTGAANNDCAPSGTACNVAFAFKILDPGACTVSGVALYGCTGGGGGGGGGHGGPPDP